MAELSELEALVNMSPVEQRIYAQIPQQHCEEILQDLNHFKFTIETTMEALLPYELPQAQIDEAVISALIQYYEGKSPS